MNFIDRLNFLLCNLINLIIFTTVFNRFQILLQGKFNVNLCNFMLILLLHLL